MSTRVRTVDVVEEVAGPGARLLLDAVAAGGHIALAGGSTAMAAYRAARTVEDADWSGATVWFSDERAVPLDHRWSNARQARDVLLDHVGARSIETVRTQLGTAAAAAEYEARIRSAVPVGETRLPRFDLVLLGMGADGHTASLPPHGAALGERERLVVHVDTPSLPPPVPRVTFTLPLIDAAAHVVFLLSGRPVADAVNRAFREPPSAAIPASLVAPTHGRLQVLLDPAAAGGVGG